MEQISIKTTDGNRYDFTREDWEHPFNTIDGDWLEVKDGPVTRRFLIRNIVSITRKPVDEG